MIFEEQGAEIEWDGETSTVTAVKGDTTVIYTIGEESAKVNGQDVALDVPGKIVDRRTLIPLRFVSEALGNTVGWENYTRTITISSATKIKSKVVRVIDGDTVEIEYEGLTETKTESIRLIGVDTPETVHPTLGEQPYGKEASDYTKSQLVVGSEVYVEMDVEERDQYGRLLGYVYLENGTFFNARLISEGYAQLSTFPPNVRWVDLYTNLQAEARVADRGLWALDEVDGETLESETGDITIVSVDKGDEIVVIRNNDDKDINMTGWTLVSVTGNQTLTFPDGFVLKARASVQILTGNGAVEKEGALLWTTANTWNNSTSDPAELYDSNGKKVSELED